MVSLQFFDFKQSNSCYAFALIRSSPLLPLFFASYLHLHQTCWKTLFFSFSTDFHFDLDLDFDEAILTHAFYLLQKAPL